MPVPCGQTTVSHELRITGSQQGISLLSIFHFHGCKKTKYAFYGKQAWCPPDNDTPISFWQLKAEVQSFFLRYCLFLQQLWFFQNIENGWRKYFIFLANLSNENELSSSTLSLYHGIFNNINVPLQHQIWIPLGLKVEHVERGVLSLCTGT